jgi:hypothetical protein
MGFREEIADEQARQRLTEALDAEIKDAEYNNLPTSDLKHIRDTIKPAFTDTGNIRHFED